MIISMIQYPKEYYQLTSALGGVFHGERDVQDNRFVSQINDIEEEIQSINEQLGELDSVARKRAIKKQEQEPKTQKDPKDLNHHRDGSLTKTSMTQSVRCTEFFLEEQNSRTGLSSLMVAIRL